MALTFTGAPPADAQVVGIKATLVDTDPVELSADFDVTVYSYVSPSYMTTYRGLGTEAGSGLPAIAYGDGDTLSTGQVTLALAGGGPNNSNIFRGSFSHTFPGPGSYTMTVATDCCVGSEFTQRRFPYPGAPTPTLVVTGDSIPDTLVTGNPALITNFTRTRTLPEGFFSTQIYAINAMTNTLPVVLDPGPPAMADIPTVSEWGMLLLGLGLALSGLWLLRR